MLGPSEAKAVLNLLSDISHDPGLSLVLHDDAQRVVEVARTDPGVLDRGRGAAEQHHVLADDVERDDDGLADDGGAAAADEGLYLVIAGDVVALLEEKSFICLLGLRVFTLKQAASNP